MSDFISKLALWQIRIAAMAVAIEVGLIALFWRQLPPEVPLFYSQTWGNEQLVTPVWLWLLPLITLMLGITTTGITRKLKDDSTLLSCWLLSTISIQIIVALALIRIIVLIV